MKRKGIHRESLTEIVFRNRNREYGSFQLQKRYLRTLFISFITGVALFLLIVLIPFAIYMINDATLDLEMEYIYEVEYIPFAPPDDVELVEMAKAHSSPPEEKLLPPVISDSITPDKEKKPLQEVIVEKKEEPAEADTSSYGTGGEEVGRQANTDTSVATTIDVYPRYPGGDEARLFYLRRHVNYPKEAVDKGIHGTIVVVFVIEPDGSVSNVKILQGIGGGCDEEAARVTREMPRWSPGKRSGKPVRVMVKMPIVFGMPGKR